MDDIPLSLLLLALVILLMSSAFFSMSETGMMAVNRYRLKNRAAQGHTGARLQIPNSLFFQRTLRRWQEAPAAASPVLIPDKRE